MYAVERLSSYITRGVYTVSGPFHPFGGAVDIIVVQQQDGSFKSSPWYVRFGKFQGVLKAKEKVVSICVNGTEAGFHMYLDHKGEAFFLSEVEGEEGENAFSPPSSGDETDEKSQNGRLSKSQSLEFDNSQSNSVTQIDMGNGKIMTRTNSRRSRIFGLMFGRKSMDDDGRHRQGDANAQLVSSLEHAEIAADLLDAKWSTNFSSINGKMVDASKSSSAEGLSLDDNRDAEFGRKEGSEIPSEHGSLDQTIAQPFQHETINPCDDVTDENSGSQILNTEHSDDTRASDDQCLTSCQPVLKASTSSSCLEDRIEIMFEHSLQEANVFSGEEKDRSSQFVAQSAPDNIDSQHPDSVKLEESTSANSIVLVDTLNELASNKRDDHLITQHAEGTERNCVYEEASIEGVSSYIYSETSIKSSTAVDESGEHVSEIPNVTGKGFKEAEVQTEVLYKPAKLTPDMNSEPESSSFISERTLNEGKDSCESHHAKADHVIGGTFENSSSKSIYFESSVNDGQQIITESLSSLNMHPSNSDFIETEMVKVIRHVTVIERPAMEEVSETEHVETFESESQFMEISSSNLFSNNEMGDEKASITPDSCVQMAEVDQRQDSIEDMNSRTIWTFSNVSNNHVQKGEGCEEGPKNDELQVSSGIITICQESNVSSPTQVVDSSMLSGSLEENRLLFADIDNLVATGVEGDELVSEDAAEKVNHLMEEIDEEHGSNFTNHESPWSSSRSFGFRSFATAGSDAWEVGQESLPSASESYPEGSRNRTNPINIPNNCRHDRVGKMVASLPNIRSHIHDLERHDVLQPLSHSLDSNSENLKWITSRKEFFGTSESAASGRNLEQEQPLTDIATTIVDTGGTGGHRHAPSSLAVEISLCRHLLFEGMGADAASQAFDSEKVGHEKFNSLGSSIVKNDKLVVRIDGQYFPWDVAAPIVLGMVAFGQGQNLHLQGMIPVDKEEKGLERELSRTIARSSGSWRLWPFNFGITRTDSTHSAPDRTNQIDARNSSESIKDMAGDNEMHEINSKKKKVVRLIVPTSEQLASLNLKDGCNVVTFTFSTAMLGRQQVDARIYLWKWDTRIVISDVDGTITKSDVLGQFMPLVGKDWSQSGVAHLFSAIKENGYQLLFLSARAISQAYITRQFLLNLKQDGKVLPDGPVVISPDGLFPSLYREVIRRAPHEFKIACLEDIRALFPTDCNPFYAGFGNRDTDEISYLKVGIPKGKIFIINPKGEVAVNHRLDVKSYTSLHALVNGMFPAMSSSEQEDFNSWNYWKMPIPEIYHM